MKSKVSKAIYPTVNSDLPQTYIQGSKTKPLYSVSNKLSHLAEPEDFDKDDRCWMYPSRIANEHQAEFSMFVDELMEESQGKRKEPHLSAYRHHLEQLLLNLTQALFQNKWLLVSQDEAAFRGDQQYIAAGWQYRTMKAALKYLEADGLIYLRIGKMYKDQPLRTRIFPTPALSPYLYQFLFGAEQVFEGPYVVVNRPSEMWLQINGAAELMEEAELAKINNFLKDHDWGAKAPVRLVYNTDPFHGGRLYTPYQNLPSRKIDIRKHTLIDGEPLCEVDFSANQLRLQLAVLHGEDAGDGPYEDIAMISGIFDREKIKAFIVRAIGSGSRHKAAGSCRKIGISVTEFNTLEAATLALYPMLKLFIGWTHQGQNLEGQILKKVMLKGVDDGVVCLPVHDAIAVQQKHELWAVKAMTTAWTEAVGCNVKPRLKVDKP